MAQLYDTYNFDVSIYITKHVHYMVSTDVTKYIQ